MGDENTFISHTDRTNTPPTRNETQTRARANTHIHSPAPASQLPLRAPSGPFFESVVHRSQEMLARAPHCAIPIRFYLFFYFTSSTHLVFAFASCVCVFVFVSLLLMLLFRSGSDAVAYRAVAYDERHHHARSSGPLAARRSSWPPPVLFHRTPRGAREGPVRSAPIPPSHMHTSARTMMRFIFAATETP